MRDERLGRDAEQPGGARAGRRRRTTARYDSVTFVGGAGRRACSRPGLGRGMRRTQVAADSSGSAPGSTPTRRVRAAGTSSTTPAGGIRSERVMQREHLVEVRRTRRAGPRPAGQQPRAHANASISMPAASRARAHRASRSRRRPGCRRAGTASRRELDAGCRRRRRCRRCRRARGARRGCRRGIVRRRRPARRGARASRRRGSRGRRRPRGRSGGPRHPLRCSSCAARRAEHGERGVEGRDRVGDRAGGGRRRPRAGGRARRAPSRTARACRRPRATPSSAPSW